MALFSRVILCFGNVPVLSWLASLDYMLSVKTQTDFFDTFKIQLAEENQVLYGWPKKECTYLMGN